MWVAITKPFAWLMVKFYELTGNYGVAVILFALLVNLILTPFMAKSKKSMMRSTRLQPQMLELQKRHEGNPQKLNMEMSKLYKEAGVNPMSGCLWSLIPFPILIALYSVIRQPLTRMLFVSQEFLQAITEYFTNLGMMEGIKAGYEEIALASFAHEHWAEVQTALSAVWDSRMMDVDLGFLGMNLGMQPRWNYLWTTNWSDVSVWLPGLGLFLIPFVSALLSWLSMKISNLANPPQDTQMQSSMGMMNWMMPLMSVWICFVMPAAMGIYWIANSVFGMVRDFVLTKVYKKQLDREDADRLAARSAKEKEIEEKHLETERLRAEGRTEMNANTSKKKLQASEKQKNEERRAAAEKAERNAKRERLGIKEEEKPASQVGARRFARGRAYVPDRYTDPDNAETATAAAAERSLDAEPIDESAEDEVLTGEKTAAEAEEAVSAAPAGEEKTEAAENAGEEKTGGENAEN